MMKNKIKNSSLVCQIAIAFVLCTLTFFKPSYAQDVIGVLVAAESSPVKKISVLEIRRIYLGLSSSQDSVIRNPVINLSDHKTYKAFLKKVMHMTENGYQRKLIKRIFRQGGEKISEVGNITDLVSHLENNRYDVSFMDEDTAKKTKGIKVIQALW